MKIKDLPPKLLPNLILNLGGLVVGCVLISAFFTKDMISLTDRTIGLVAGIACILIVIKYLKRDFDTIKKAKESNSDE